MSLDKEGLCLIIINLVFKYRKINQKTHLKINLKSILQYHFKEVRLRKDLKEYQLYIMYQEN